MKILCALGEHNYGNPARGGCYEYVNFLPALRNLGHEIVFFESFNRRMYADFAEQNRRFLELIEAEKPDVILCVLLSYELWLETFELIRKGSNAIIINWSTDDSWKYEQFSRLVAPAFHTYATTYPDALAKSKRDGHDNFFLTQWAANSASLVEPLRATQCQYSVSFIGTAYGNRHQWVSALGKRGINVECFGHGWANGPISSEDIPKIMRSSIVSLNFGDSGFVMNGIVPGRSRQIKARIFEVPGAGGFLMSESAEGLDQFYRTGEEIVVFNGLDDLVDKITHFVACAEERDRIAMAGHQKTRTEHTYEIRFKKLLEYAFEKHRVAIKPNVSINFEEFKLIEKKHKVGIALKLLRILLLMPCMVFWGKSRGPRAARRILFELSWRLAGRKTYTASGWPGRLFYKES